MPPGPATTATSDEPLTGGAAAPRLRFPDFAGRPIRSLTLGEVTEDCTDRKGAAVTGMPIMGVSKTHGIVPMEVRLIGKDTARYKRVEHDWFAYNPMRLNIGSIARWRGDKSVLVSPDYVVFRCLEEGANALSPDYLDQFTSSTQWEDFVSGSGDGGVRVRIYYKDLAQLRLRLPHPAEQHKIADCLASIDEVIAAQGRKVEMLKAHKKGLMQHLFPQEGQTVPRFRFPEFRDGHEWDRMPLGEIAEIKLGKMLDAKKNTGGRHLPYLNNLAVRWNAVDTSNLPQMPFDDDELDRFGLRAGDVLVCEGGEPGRSAVWDGRDPDMKFQKAVHRVRFKVPYAPHLLVSYLENIAGSQSFEALFTGGGIKHLTRETFALLPVPIPTPAEQQHIADCLSALDARVDADAARLDAFKAHKKGLMQRLFPSGAPT